MLLGDNSLTALTKATFNGLSSVTLLDLHRNSLTSLPADVFDHVSTVGTLHLTNNSIGSLPEGLFDGLLSLSHIQIAWNDDGGHRHVAGPADQPPGLRTGDGRGPPPGPDGAGQGDWWLELSSDAEIDVGSYVRTTDGFLTAMHDLAPGSDGEYRVVIFNPADI